MNKITLTAALGLAVAALSSAQTISVGAAFAPNAFGSATFDTWAANTISGLTSGTNQVGPAGTPAAYDNVAGLTFQNKTNIVTNFQSWKGDAPGGFAGEFGTRMHFPVKIVADTEFTLAQVTYDMNSSDAGNAMNFDGNLAGTSFGVRRRGVFYGADNILGGGDDVIYDQSNPGSDSTLINEIEYVGIGNAYEALLGDPGATNQDKIDGVAMEIGGYSLETTYSVAGTGAMATTVVNFTQPVPEPATMAALGLGAVALLRRRRRAAK